MPRCPRCSSAFMAGHVFLLLAAVMVSQHATDAAAQCGGGTGVACSLSGVGSLQTEDHAEELGDETSFLQTYTVVRKRRG
eukprot:CAMPEP_0115503454 /NCGR_PEP_ID=MMETSP0271-20121206/69484_1 /TAXON_ID=71861 /ORGANISM="Scrippsiella trochoidea, Strain CCMP3099" /LENGTH=79 /DNA_ID=CAMNT_0002932545 /DNA_START=51 /DNA_END=287 /DNA_ORIENTATION=+